MSMTWKKVRIGEVYKLNKAQLSDKAPMYNDFWYLDLSAVKRGSVSFPTNKIRFEEASPRARRILKKNNVIVSTVRPNLQGFAIADFDTNQFVCSTGFALIEALDYWDAQFLYQNLYTKSVTDQLESLVTGSNYPAISSSDVEALVIPYPPTKRERDKIAKILSTWDEAIEQQTKLIELKEKRKKALMQLLLNEDKNNKRQKFNSYRLGELAIIKGRLGWKGLKQEEYTTSGPSLVAGKHIKDGRILWEKCDHITKERYEESLEIALELGDVIFSKDGTLGNPAIVRIKPEFATINSTMMLVRSTSQKLHPEYLFQHLRSDHFERMIAEKTSGSSIPHIFQADMKNYPISLPPLSEQIKIAKGLYQMDKELYNEKNILSKIMLQKQGMMQRLLTGVNMTT